MNKIGREGLHSWTGTSRYCEGDGMLTCRCSDGDVCDGVDHGDRWW